LDAANDNTKNHSFGFGYFFNRKTRNYTNYRRANDQSGLSGNKVYNEAILPTSVLINTFQKKGNTEINLEYNSVSFNEELSFPYSVPNGYKRILIK
jgi:hypothetical protein